VVTSSSSTSARADTAGDEVPDGDEDAGDARDDGHEDGTDGRDDRLKSGREKGRRRSAASARRGNVEERRTDVDTTADSGENVSHC
jgi:hypothetical protein